jgi:hypothetical protein
MLSLQRSLHARLLAQSPSRAQKQLPRAVMKESDNQQITFELFNQQRRNLAKDFAAEKYSQIVRARNWSVPGAFNSSPTLLRMLISAGAIRTLGITDSN